jgi:hypothetical protein
VTEVRGQLDRTVLAGVDRPGGMLRTCWQVLAKAGDPAADLLLAQAHRYLLDCADSIGDDEMRSGFLAVPVNAELVAAGERLSEG